MMEEEGHNQRENNEKKDGNGSKGHEEEPILTAEKIFQTIRRNEMEILRRAWFPEKTLEKSQINGAADDTKQKSKTKTTEKESKQEPSRKNDAETVTQQAECKSAEKDQDKRNDEKTCGLEGNVHVQVADSNDVNEDESIGSFTEPMYWCCICIYRKRAHNKKRKDETEKRPGLLKRFRRFVSRTFRRERQE